MLTKIIKIGHLMRPPDLYRNFVQQVNTENGLALFINLAPMEYRGIRIIETPNENHLLLYCDQRGQVSGKSPTVNLTLKNKKSAEKLKEDIQKALQKMRNFFEGEVENIGALIEENSEKIIQEIENILQNMNEKSTYLTIIIIQDNQELRPAEYEPFKQLFLKKAFSKATETSVNGVCHFCGESKAVSATVNEVFTFATFDKPGFCPSLKKEDAIKVLPICEECKTNLQNGANVLRKDLSFNFLGNKLWVIPSLVVEDENALKNVINKIKQVSNELKDFAKKEKTIEQALCDQDQVHYDFLFMEMNQSQQRIELHLTEISPTRLRQLVEVAQEVKQKMDMEDIPEPTLGLLWYLYEKPTSRSEERKEYLALVRSIFQAEPYNLQRFLWYCMRRIRKAAQEYVSNDRESFGWRKLTYLSFASILYLNQIGVFNLKKGENKVNSDELSAFFDKYPEFFNESWKKAVFLTGILAGKVLSIQYAKRQATPFFKKLKGLKMNMQDIQGLLAEIRNKLQQYGSYGQRIDLLMKSAAAYYLESAKQKSTVDELNFVFTLGLAYSNKEPFKIEEVEENE
ncbi:TIGR02556 family CRISPR-associated protein [Thermotoga profunda]|uniref:TIGR02556 family CRISPR-associated protein n=1 Tax=Thermotoga profunda TaxID=1508420 RepID=UPI000596DB2C|nr:TIGR02556 family CRISPR-associated protein [Thermotoga profunda]